MAEAKKISELTSRSASSITGNEQIPVSESGANYRISVDGLAEYIGVDVFAFDLVTTKTESDTVVNDTPSSGATGDIAYVSNVDNGIFAFRVESSGNYVFYKQFTSTDCHTGAPIAGKTYLCGNPATTWRVVGSIFTQITPDIDSKPTYTSTNTITSNAVFLEEVKSATVSPAYANRAFSVDSSYSTFTFNESQVNASLIIKYDGKSNHVEIPGLETHDHYCWWVGMKEFGVWQYSNCIFFRWDVIPEDLSTIANLKYIGVTFVKAQHTNFDAENATIKWIGFEEGNKQEIMLNKLFLSDFTSSTKEPSSTKTWKIVRPTGVIDNSSSMAVLVFTGITPTSKCYGFSGNILPSSSFTNVAVVSFWDGDTFIGYSYYKSGPYNQEKMAEISVPLNCDTLMIQAANREGYIDTVVLKELSVSDGRISSSELDGRIGQAEKDIRYGLYDFEQLTPVDRASGSFMKNDGTTTSNSHMGYAKFLVYPGEVLELSYYVLSGYQFPIILFKDSSSNVISYIDKIGLETGMEMLVVPENAVEAYCNYIPTYIYNPLRRKAEKKEINIYSQIGANKSLLSDYVAKTKTASSVEAGVYISSGGQYREQSSMSVNVYSGINPNKAYRYRGKIVPQSGYTIHTVSYWNNDTFIAFDKNTSIVGPYSQDTSLALNVPSTCNIIKIQAYNGTGYLESVVLEELDVLNPIYVKDINDRFLKKTYVSMTPDSDVSGGFMLYTGTIRTDIASMGYRTYSVSSGKKYAITYSLPTSDWNFSTYVFLSSSGSVVGYKSMTGPASATDEEIIAPNGAEVIYCNYILSIGGDFDFKEVGTELISIREINDVVEQFEANKTTKVVVSALEPSIDSPAFYIRAKYNNEKDIIIKHSVNRNGLLTFNSTYVGAKTLTDAQIMSSSYLVSTHTDSTAPLFHVTQYWHLFAQHGYPIPYFANPGGFTNSDVGALWVDQLDRQFTIGKVTTSYVYLLPVIYTSGSHDVRDWKSTVFSTTITSLTHVSGGSYTTTTTVSSISQIQLRPITEHSNRTWSIDGKPITSAGTYYGSEFKVSESYIGYDPATIDDWFGGENGNPDLTNAEAMAEFTYSFNYTGAQCCVNTTISIQREVECQGYGACQQQFFLDNGSYKAMFMIPKVKPQGNVVLDKPFNSASASSQSYSFYRTSTYLKDVDDIPDRQIGYLYKSSDNSYLVGMAAGLSLVSGDTVPDKRNQMCLQGSSNDHYRVLLFSPSNTNKFYVMAFNTSPYADNDYYLPNTFFKEINYYVSYFDPAENVGQVYWYKDGSQYVIYCHCQSSQSRLAINVPSFMEGLSLSIVEKTDNALLLTDTIQNGKFFVTYSTADANYIVLKAK